MKRQGIIIDTDIGHDVDDAFALCLAMRSPEVRILGVTTVHQNTDLKAMIARRLLDLGGCSDVPVRAGHARPLEETHMYGRTLDYDEVPPQFSESYRTDAGWARGADEFIIEQLENHPGEVTLVTLGALTNIASVFQKRPDLIPNVREICMMGGAYYTNWLECNFCCDPLAADVVARSGAKIRACGTDVTFQCVVPDELIQTLDACQNPVIRMLETMRGQWGHGVMLHDPLALWTVFDPSVVTYKRKKICVEHEAAKSNGFCVELSNWNWGETPVDFFAADTVRANEFVEMCISRIRGFG